MSFTAADLIIPDENDVMLACSSKGHGNRRKSTRRSLLIIADRSFGASPRCLSTPIQRLSQHGCVEELKSVTGKPTVPITQPATIVDHTPENLFEAYREEMEKWKKIVSGYRVRLKSNPVAEVDIPIEMIVKDRIVSRYREILYPAPDDSGSINTRGILNLRDDIMYELTCLPNILQRLSSFLSSVNQKAIMNMNSAALSIENDSDYSLLLMDFMEAPLDDY